MVSNLPAVLSVRGPIILCLSLKQHKVGKHGQPSSTGRARPPRRGIAEVKCRRIS